MELCHFSTTASLANLADHLSSAQCTHQLFYVKLSCIISNMMCGSAKGTSLTIIIILCTLGGCAAWISAAWLRKFAVLCQRPIGSSSLTCCDLLLYKSFSGYIDYQIN